MKASSSTKVVLHAYHDGPRRQQRARPRKKNTSVSLLAGVDGGARGCHRLEIQPTSKGETMVAW